jgi:hypothetical protein
MVDNEDLPQFRPGRRSDALPLYRITAEKRGQVQVHARALHSCPDFMRQLLLSQKPWESSDRPISSSQRTSPHALGWCNPLEKRTDSLYQGHQASS